MSGKAKTGSGQDLFVWGFFLLFLPVLQFHCFLNIKRYTNAFEADKMRKVKQSSAKQELEYL